MPLPTFCSLQPTCAFRVKTLEAEDSKVGRSPSSPRCCRAFLLREEHTR